MTSANQSFCAGIEDALGRTEAVIAERLSSACEPVRSFVAQAGAHHGKRMRPVLLLQSAKVFGPPSERHVLAAAAVELLHTATLIHDDVVDAAAIRRGHPTLNSTCGVDVPVLLGDYLVAQVMLLLVQMNHSPSFGIIARAARDVCEGETHQLLRRGDFGLSEEEYLSIVERKTASLFAASCRLGAVLADAPADAVEALERYGCALGTAFQIVDDCLDIAGTEAREGKSLGSDLQNGKLTLPGIRLLQSAAGADRDELLSLLEPDDTGRHREDLAGRMLKEGCIQGALDTARELIANAKNELSALPDVPAAAVLSDAADYVIERAEL